LKAQATGHVEEALQVPELGRSADRQSGTELRRDIAELHRQPPDHARRFTALRDFIDDAPAAGPEGMPTVGAGATDPELRRRRSTTAKRSLINS
jgi:hypothetical protein